MPTGYQSVTENASATQSTFCLQGSSARYFQTVRIALTQSNRFRSIAPGTTACQYCCRAAILNHWHDTIRRHILSFPSVPQAHLAVAAGAVSAGAFPGLYGHTSQSFLRDNGLSRTYGRFLPRPPASKRLVQGYNVSGPLILDTCIAVDRDLTDSTWRGLFHSALVENRRFQRGLFDGTDITGRHKDGHAEQTLMVRLTDVSFETTPFTVAGIRQLSRRRLIGREADLFDYGLALLKTSASLVYTIQLATAEQLAVATDSRAHFTLLTRLIDRMGFTIENGLVEQGMS